MMRKISTRTVSLLLSVSILANQCLCFVPRTTVAAGLSPSFNSIPVHETSGFLPRDTLTLAIGPSADMEAEVLTTMAHVTMDFSGFVNPSKNLLRCFAVLGRVFAISADYIIDHSIHPEELFIQLFLMSIAIKDIIFDTKTNSD